MRASGAAAFLRAYKRPAHGPQVRRLGVQGTSEAAQNGHYFAENLGLIAGDRRVGRVMRHQPDVLGGAFEGLDRGLAFQHRGHDVAILGHRLLAHDHPVAVRDSRVHHRVADDLEQEESALADDLPGQREDVLDRLFGQDRPASGDPPDERYVGRLLRGDVHGGVVIGVRLGPDGRMPWQPDLDGPGPASVPAQISLGLQRGELIGDARRAGQADRLANLAHGRRIAAALYRLADYLQHLALPPGKHVIGIGLVRQLRHDMRHAALRASARLAARPRIVFEIDVGHVHVNGRGLLRPTIAGRIAHLWPRPVGVSDADANGCAFGSQTSVRHFLKVSYPCDKTVPYLRSIERAGDRTEILSNSHSALGGSDERIERYRDGGV